MNNALFLFFTETESLEDILQSSQSEEEDDMDCDDVPIPAGNNENYY